jgi:hypothetical protein
LNALRKPKIQNLKLNTPYPPPIHPSRSFLLVDIGANDTTSRKETAPLKSASLSSGAVLAGWILLGLMGLALVASFWVIIPAGERGVWMRFGQVQEEILAEGLHFVIPLVDSVETLSTRVQK